MGLYAVRATSCAAAVPRPATVPNVWRVHLRSTSCLLQPPVRFTHALALPGTSFPDPHAYPVAPSVPPAPLLLTTPPASCALPVSPAYPSPPARPRELSHAPALPAPSFPDRPAAPATCCATGARSPTTGPSVWRAPRQPTFRPLRRPADFTCVDVRLDMWYWEPHVRSAAHYARGALL